LRSEGAARGKHSPEETYLRYFQAEGDVLQNSSIWKERIFLGHITAAAVRLAAKFTIDEHFAAGRHLLPEYEAQER
jgi:hypothetical protein